MPMRWNPKTGQYEDAAGNAAPPPSGGGVAGPGTGGAVLRPPSGPPADATGGANLTHRPTIQPAAQPSGGPSQGGPQGGQAAQPRTRSAPAPWIGGGATIPPPPPPIPGAAPAPNFGAALSGLGAPTKGATYQSNVNVAPATMGPQYQTAEGAWQGEELLPDLTAFSRDWMQNYNPLNSGYGAAAREGANANLRKMETDQTKGLEEFMASRGLIGSSVETDGRIENNESLRRTALDEEARIMELIGSMELAGRQSAGSFGLGVGGFAQGLGNDRRAEGQYAHEADRTRGRDFEDDTRFRAGFEEDQDRFGYESEYRAGRDLVGDQFNRAGMELDAAGMQGDAELNRYLADLEAKRMAETGIIDRAQLGLDRDDLSQRSWRDNAGLTADYDRMAQEDEQFAGDSAFRDRELGQNQSQYEGDSAFRDRELEARTEAERNKLFADIADSGMDITQEMSDQIFAKTGVRLPVTTKKDETKPGDTGAPQETRGPTPPTQAKNGDTWTATVGIATGKTYTYRDGQWYGPDGKMWVRA